MWLNNISLCRYFVISKWAVPFCLWYLGWFPFGFLWMMHPWTFVYKFLCDMFSFLLHIDLVELMGHSTTLCQFWGAAKLLSKELCYFAFFPAMYKASNFLISSPTLTFCVFFKNYYSHPNRCEIVTHCGFSFHEDLHLFSSKSFIVLAITFKCLIIFS